MKMNFPKVIESWLRHLKGNAATALLVPAFLEAIHKFTPQGFSYGLNWSTVILVLVAIAVATVTVGFQLLAKKRPEFAPEIALAEKKSIEVLGGFATANIAFSPSVAASPDPATVGQGVPTS